MARSPPREYASPRLDALCGQESDESPDSHVEPHRSCLRCSAQSARTVVRCHGACAVRRANQGYGRVLAISLPVQVVLVEAELVSQEGRHGGLPRRRGRQLGAWE